MAHKCTPFEEPVVGQHIRPPFVATNLQIHPSQHRKMLSTAKWFIIALVVTASSGLRMAAADMEDDPYKSSSFIGHSLWMCPSGAAKEAYSSIIAENSSKLGTFRFTPHTTLVAAIMTGADDVVERTRKLAKKLTPYEFELDLVSQRDAYFQCVFAKMKTTKVVVDANNLAREIFPERRDDPAYLPHLSLVYGDFTLEKKISQIIPDIERMLNDKKSETASFQVDSIEVWSTQGDVKDWYIVDTIPLEGDPHEGDETCASQI